MNRPAQTPRGAATPALAPVARAVRLALAASATALALTAPAPGIAAPKYPPARAAQDGRADVRLALRAGEGPAPVDMTLVAGEVAPSSVIPDLRLGISPQLEQGGDIVGEGDGDIIALELHDPTVVELHNTGTISAIAHPDATSAARATGLFAMAGDVLVDNDGSIDALADADGGYARARAVETFAYGAGSTVHNAGDIGATAVADGGTARAFGVYSFGYGSSSVVDNAGDVRAVAQADGGRAYATAINSIGYGVDAIVANTGTLAAQADGARAYAFGVVNLATRQDGIAQVDDAGTIDVVATGTYATATGVINAMFRYGAAGVTQAGDLDATADGSAGGSATGIYNYAYRSDASVDNTGTIGVHATADDGMALATGIYDKSGSIADVHNAGGITVDAAADAGLAMAWGVVALSGDTVYVVNEGDIAVDAQAGNGDALAAGIYASANAFASATNLGTVSAQAGTVDGDATAYGAILASGGSGIAVLVNGGDIDASATVTGAGDASAIGGYVIADVATVFNDGSATASAVSAGGDAVARALGAYGNYSAISNYGASVATASATGGDALARGSDAYGYFGAATYNAGDIQAHAIATAGDATAYGAYTLGAIFGAYTTNTGTIAATAQGDSAVAQGVVNAALYLGNAITVNDGSIVAAAEGGIAPYGETEAIAFGVYNLALVYDSIVVNDGSILAQATATAELDDGFTQAKAIGAGAFNAYGYGDTGIVNHGDIGAVALTDRGYSVAWGAVVRSGGAYGGATILDNSGTIHAQAISDLGISMTLGAYVASLMGDAAITNAGDISAYSRTERGIPGQFANTASATALYARAMYGQTDIANTGTLVGHGVGYGALVYVHGVQSYGDTLAIDNAAGASIVAIGEVERFGFAGATGVEAHGIYGVGITNAGDVTAYATAHGWSEGEYVFLGASGAVGIYGEASFFGNVAVTNTGDVSAVAVSSENVDSPSGAAGANGIIAYGKYDATVVNAGDVLASATSDLGIAGAYGVQVHGKYSGNLVNEAGATIVALARVGSQDSDTYAGRAVAFGGHMFGTDHGYIGNDGRVVAQAIATADDAANAFPTMASAYGLSIGANSDGIDGLIVNRGDVEARASADFGIASAYGTNVRTSYGSGTQNAGSILAVATAAQGDAFAVGAQVYSMHFDYYVPCTPYGCDYSNPTYTPDGGEASLDNAGTLVAAAYADDGVAHSYGAGVFGGFGAAVTNAGDITAIADADHATATGVFAAAPYGSVDVANAGTILAAAYGPGAIATGVRMTSGGVNTLVNTGTIAALGDGARYAITSGAGAQAVLSNQGTLVGAITTAELDDTLDNAAGALWRALGTSDFGAGADGITNAGTLKMDDAIIRLGAAGEGDAFANTGLIVVAGDANAIELPGAAFTNDGVVSFLDFATGDSLSLLGDLAGNGSLQFDASGRTLAGDRLYVDGNVSGSQVIDVNLLDAPTAASTLIPLVFVSGDSTAGSFALGNVATNGAGFLSLDFHLDAAIDATNADADVFSLGMTVTGLNDAGALASALAPGVQGVVDAQVGTWRQRSGAPRGRSDGVLEPWLRVFADGGDYAPTHAGIGADGILGYHQSNRGWELGLDTRPSGKLALGLLIASSEGSQQLDAAPGRADLDARTFGLYGTWLGDRFYFDASQRWIGVDARLGAKRTEATASVLNLEAGYTGWSVGGLHVVPQVQYTHSRIGDVAPIHDGASTFEDDGGLSSRVRLGVALDRTFSAGGYALTPSATLNAVREFDGDYDHVINGGLEGTTSTAGTSAQVELGLDARKGRFSIGGSVHWTDGGAVDGRTGGQLTVRYRW
jgi:hypothetical protein